MLQALRSCQTLPSEGDPLLAIPKGESGKYQSSYHQQNYIDPEDLIHDIMQGMLLPANPQTSLKKEEEKMDVKMEDVAAEPTKNSQYDTM